MAYNDKLKEKGITAAMLQRDFDIKVRAARYILAGASDLPLSKARKMCELYKIAWKDFK